MVERSSTWFVYLLYSTCDASKPTKLQGESTCVKEGPPKCAHNFCSRLDFQCCDRFFLVLGVLRHCSGILKANTEFNKQIIAVNSGPSRWSSRHLQTVSFHVTRSYLLTHQIWRNQVEKKTHLSILSGINVIHLPRSAKDGCQIDQFWQGGESFFFDVVPTWLGGVNFSAYCYLIWNDDIWSNSFLILWWIVAAVFLKSRWLCWLLLICWT